MSALKDEIEKINKQILEKEKELRCLKYVVEILKKSFDNIKKSSSVIIDGAEEKWKSFVNPDSTSIPAFVAGFQYADTVASDKFRNKLNKYIKNKNIKFGKNDIRMIVYLKQKGKASTKEISSTLGVTSDYIRQRTLYMKKLGILTSSGTCKNDPKSTISIKKGFLE